MIDFENIALSYNITPESEISDRISRFQSLLQREEVKAAVIVQLIDRFYFSGTIQDGVLIIPAEGDPRYLCRRSVERARAESPLQVIPFKSFKEVPLALEDLGTPNAARLGLELDVIPAALYQRFSSLVQGADWVDLGPLVREVRDAECAAGSRRLGARLLDLHGVGFPGEP